jgi:hypothetical protein
VRTFKLFIAIVLPAVASAGAIPAADLAVMPPAPVVRPSVIAISDFQRREAVALLIRETFNLINTDEVLRQLTSATRRLGTSGPTEADHVALDRALLAEGSYYLVSLRYLIQAGGAAWPADRPARFYENDALVRLDALQERLFEAVETRADPLPIFLEGQAIWALTDGYEQVPEQLDVFGHRDALVEAAMARAIPRAKT